MTGIAVLENTTVGLPGLINEDPGVVTGNAVLGKTVVELMGFEEEDPVEVTGAEMLEKTTVELTGFGDDGAILILDAEDNTGGDGTTGGRETKTAVVLVAGGSAARVEDTIEEVAATEIGAVVAGGVTEIDGGSRTAVDEVLEVELTAI